MPSLPLETHHMRAQDVTERHSFESLLGDRRVIEITPLEGKRWTLGDSLIAEMVELQRQIVEASASKVMLMIDVTQFGVDFSTRISTSKDAFQTLFTLHKQFEFIVVYGGQPDHRGTLKPVKGVDTAKSVRMVEEVMHRDTHFATAVSQQAAINMINRFLRQTSSQQ